MAVSFTRLSYWVWGENTIENPKNSLSSSSDFSSGYREPDSLKCHSKKEPKVKSSSSRRIKKKWQNREERITVDKEYDIVLVTSDGGSYSDCESDDSDWSVGWLEPHGPEFGADMESFAVLVPCYGGGRNRKVREANNGVLGAVHSQAMFTTDDKDYIEQWLDSLQKM